MDLKEAIVIKTLPYKDNTKIVYVLTKEGRENFILKGASSLKSSAQQFSKEISHISFATNKNYFTAGKLINVFPRIKENINLTFAALKIIELIDALGEHTNNPDLFFDFSLKNLYLLDEGFDPVLVNLIFYLKSLYLFGLNPSFKDCINCGTKDNILGFVVNYGGVICKDCKKITDYVEKTSDSDILKYLYYTKLDQIDFEMFKEVNLSSSQDIINRFYEHYLGFKSKVKTLDNLIYK